MRKWMCVFAVILLAANGACSSRPSGDTASEVVVTEAPATVDEVATPMPTPFAPAATPTPAPSPTPQPPELEILDPADPPVHYLKYGEAGLYRVDSQGEELIHTGEVWSATTDGAEGFVFGVLGPTGVDYYWWPEREDPLLLTGRVLAGLAADGHPAVISIGSAPDLCADTYWQEAVYLTDLTTGTPTFLFCDTDGPDGGHSLTSVGDDRMSTVGWEIWEPWTCHDIQLIDFAGNRVSWAANPVPESCAPCELDAALSPDGQFLAYRHRPDAYWPSERAVAMTEDEWWATTQAIPGTIRVIDVATGAEKFEMEVPATAHLVDFDGRYIVVADSPAIGGYSGIDHSDIIDTTGALPPITISGNWHIELIPGPADG